MGLAPLMTVLFPDKRGKLDILTAEADSFLGPEAAVVEDAEEGDEARAAGSLRADGLQQRPCLGGVDDDAAVYLMRYLGRPPLDALDGVGVEQLELDGVVERVEQDGPVPAH